MYFLPNLISDMEIWADKIIAKCTNIIKIFLRKTEKVIILIAYRWYKNKNLDSNKFN